MANAPTEPPLLMAKAPMDLVHIDRVGLFIPKNRVVGAAAGDFGLTRKPKELFCTSEIHE